MSSSNQEQTESYEETQSNSSLWASERGCGQYGHSLDSGEEGDIDSSAGYETASYSEKLEIDSPLIVDQATSSDDRTDRVIYISARKLSLKNSDDLLTNVRKRTRPITEIRRHSMDCELQAQSGTTQGDDSDNSTSVEGTNVPVAVFAERSSPERPFLRPPNATAKQLIEIHRNYRREASQEWPVFLPPNMDEDLQNLEHPDPAKRPRYLPLAPPYHLLPNTSFFRKASIKPPPSYITDGLPPLKRIINRYLSSILVDHVKLEEQLRLLIEEREKDERIELRKLQGGAEKNEDIEQKFEKPEYDDFLAENRWKTRRKPRVVVQHLHYGGQLIHYIQNGCDPPPAVPGYFTAVPLIPSNVKITRELGGTAFAEYQQQRTAHGFIYVPVTTTVAESYTEQGPTQSSPSPVSPKESLQTDHNERINRRSDSEDEPFNCGGSAPSGFSVITTERYASISFTASTMSMRFAERCVSLSRSPQHG